MSEVSAKPAIPSILAVAKHPLPTELYVIFGVPCLFSYSILHLALLSFTFTYMNICTLNEFGIYPSLMTGNYFNSALLLEAKLYGEVEYRVVMIIACTLFGTLLDCYLLTILRSREKAFSVIITLLAPSLIIADYWADQTGCKYTLIVLCVTAGALVHWNQKLGYTCSAMTGNLFKLAEQIFLISHGYDLGGPKMNGEFFVTIAILVSSMVGALFAIYMIKISESVSHIPLLVTLPFHFYLGGCLKAWGVWGFTHASSTNDGKAACNVAQGSSGAGHEGVELSDTGSSVKSPLSSHYSSSVDRSGNVLSAAPSRAASTDTSASSSNFERRSVTLAELQQLEDIEASFGYKAEKALFIDL